MGSTPAGLPYPEPTDPDHLAAAHIRKLAGAVNFATQNSWITFTSVAGPTNAQGDIDLTVPMGVINGAVLCDSNGTGPGMWQQLSGAPANHVWMRRHSVGPNPKVLPNTNTHVHAMIWGNPPANPNPDDPGTLPVPADTDPQADVPKALKAFAEAVQPRLTGWKFTAKNFQGPFNAQGDLEVDAGMTTLEGVIPVPFYDGSDPSRQPTYVFSRVLSGAPANKLWLRAWDAGSGALAAGRNFGGMLLMWGK